MDATGNAVPAAVRVRHGGEYRVVWDDAGFLRMQDRARYDAPARAFRLNRGRGDGRQVAAERVVLVAERAPRLRCGGEVFRPLAPLPPEAA